MLATLLACFCLISAGAQAQSDDLKKRIQKAEEQITKEIKQSKRDLAKSKAEAPIVIELFTASDCSACIYADRMLYDAMKNPNVIALSCHIKDKAGVGGDSDYRILNSSSSDPLDPCVFRQWTYLRNASDMNSILSTPEFVFANGDKVDSTNFSTFESNLNELTYANLNKTLWVQMAWKDEDTLTITLPEAELQPYQSLSAGVSIVRYKDIMIEKATDGPNKGKVLRFSNIIQDTRHISKWYGQKRVIDLNVGKPLGGEHRGGYVILIQEMLGENILAAGKLADYETANDKRQSGGAAKTP